MSNEKILIVDDEKEMCLLVKSFLDNEQFQTYTAYDATSALELLESVEPDLILLDIMLPDISGVDLCLQIRNKVAAPILFMSCKSEEIDKIIALSVGGDDYITKPFNSGELIARIKAHLRRERRARQAEAERNPVYECRGLEVDETARTVQLDGQPVNVTTKEFDILLTLIRSPKRVFSMDQLFELVWKEESLAGDSRTCLLYTSPSPRDRQKSRMPSSA